MQYSTLPVRNLFSFIVLWGLEGRGQKSTPLSPMKKENENKKKEEMKKEEEKEVKEKKEEEEEEKEKVKLKDSFPKLSVP